MSDTSEEFQQDAKVLDPLSTPHDVENLDIFVKRRAILKVRTGDGWPPVKEWSLENEGRVLTLSWGGVIDANESSLYANEGRWYTNLDEVGKGGPGWLASGDLWFQGEAYIHPTEN